MLLVIFPVEYLVQYTRMTRPLPTAVILTFHEIYRHRNVCAFSTTNPISMNTQTKLDASQFRVEGLAEPLVTIFLVL